MNRILIYITYVPYEYTNYFCLAINDDVLCRDVPQEQIEDLFVQINDKKLSENEMEWCIVQGENVTPWDYESILQEYGFKIRPAHLKDIDICQLIGKLFDDTCTVKKNNTTDKLITVLYPTSSFMPKEKEKKDFEVVNTPSEEVSCKYVMTELAKIIKEKYERMKQYE